MARRVAGKTNTPNRAGFSVGGRSGAISQEARIKIAVDSRSGYPHRAAELTRLLDAANRGGLPVPADLLPLVYDELRKLAAARMSAAQERGFRRMNLVTPSGKPSSRQATS